MCVQGGVGWVGEGGVVARFGHDDFGAGDFCGGGVVGGRVVMREEEEGENRGEGLWRAEDVGCVGTLGMLGCRLAD